MNKINAKWKQKGKDKQTWYNYQDFWTNELLAVLCDHGVKNQQVQMANCMTAMESSIEGIRSEQQTIQNGFQEFSNEVH